MDGILHIMERVGQSLALVEQRCVDLEAENAQLRQALAERVGPVEEGPGA